MAQKQPLTKAKKLAIAIALAPVIYLTADAIIAWVLYKWVNHKPKAGG